MTIRALVVDDEPLARERLRTLLRDEADVDLIAECENGREAIETIGRDQPDLVFLDVQMPVLDGFGVVDALDPARLPAIVFVTAYDEYALKAFEVHALDYLLKPFTAARFRDAMRHIRARRAMPAGHAPAPGLRQLIEDRRAGQRPQRRLAIRSGGQVVFLRTAEIDWLEAEGNYVRVHVRGETHLMRGALKVLESSLDPQDFIRIHRSAVVNLNRVKHLEPWFHGEFRVVMHDGSRLTCSRSYSERIRRMVR